MSVSVVIKQIIVHRLDHFGVKVLLCAATGRPNLVPTEPLEEGVRHLRAPGVADTEEQHVQAA